LSVFSGPLASHTSIADGHDKRRRHEKHDVAVRDGVVDFSDRGRRASRRWSKEQENAMSSDDVSRRSLLQAIVATIVAAPSVWTEIARVANDSQTAAHLAGAAKLSFLGEAEAVDIEAVVAQIIPTDDTPGAREAGAVYFIDRALATFLARFADDYRAQLAEFQEAFRAQHPLLASFASLSSARQVEYLRTVEHTPFFGATRLLTLLGLFALPGYGGNRNGLGWKLIGFEDRHVFQPPFGYYDRDYPGFVIDRRRTP
jgi:hypothetical protein